MDKISLGWILLFSGMVVALFTLNLRNLIWVGVSAFISLVGIGLIIWGGRSQATAKRGRKVSRRKAR